MQNALQFEKISDIQLLKHKVYEAIKRRIIDLTLPPGEQLVEQRLAEGLGVSKSPVREALLRLEREGLVYTLPFKGCFVAEITEKEIHEIFQFREALEAFCLKKACRSFSEEEMRKVKEILSEANEALQQENINRCVEYNIQFHDFIFSKSNNERIIHAYSMLRDELNRYWNIARRILGRVAKSQKEHIWILEAIEQRDEFEAERRLSEHLHSLLDDFINSKELQSYFHK